MLVLWIPRHFSRPYRALPPSYSSSSSSSSSAPPGWTRHGRFRRRTDVALHPGNHPVQSSLSVEGGGEKKISVYRGNRKSGRAISEQRKPRGRPSSRARLSFYGVEGRNGKKRFVEGVYGRSPRSAAAGVGHFVGEFIIRNGEFERIDWIIVDALPPPPPSTRGRTGPPPSLQRSASLARSTAARRRPIRNRSDVSRKRNELALAIASAGATFPNRTSAAILSRSRCFALDASPHRVFAYRPRI